MTLVFIPLLIVVFVLAGGVHSDPIFGGAPLPYHVVYLVLLIFTILFFVYKFFRKKNI